MPFQTAKFSLTLHKDHVVFKTGVTPPELAILRGLHYKEAQGSPIGDDLQLEEGFAQTVDREGKPEEGEYFIHGSGKVVPMKAAVPPETHDRTQEEEIERLTKKYATTMPHTPSNTLVFVELFGSPETATLPESFDAVVKRFKLPGILPVEAKAEVMPRSVANLVKLDRHELVTKAAELDIVVGAKDSKETIIGKIVMAQNPPSEPVGASLDSGDASASIAG